MAKESKEVVAANWRKLNDQLFAKWRRIKSKLSKYVVVTHVLDAKKAASGANLLGFSALVIVPAQNGLHILSSFEDMISRVEAFDAGKKKRGELGNWVRGSEAGIIIEIGAPSDIKARKGAMEDAISMYRALGSNKVERVDAVYSGGVFKATVDRRRRG